MDVNVRIQDVYNSTLNETEKKLVVVVGLYQRVHIGTLFFKQDPYECLMPKIHESVKVESTNAKEICLVAYELLKEFGMLKKGTLKTMAHWQHVNGVTDEMLDGYNYDTDEEFYKSLMGGN